MGRFSGNIIVDNSRSFGLYIIIETPSVRKYILLSSKKNEGRNSYIAQAFYTAYSDFILYKTKKKKVFEIFLFPNKSIKASYNILMYKFFKTCKIKIINERELLGTTIAEFNSYKEIEDFRDNNRNRNSGNKSTYFSEEEDHINIFGKVYGANGKETALISFALSKISKKPVWLYQIYEHASKLLSSKDLKALELSGVKIKETFPEFGNSNISLNAPEKDLRDTPKFHYNLLKKFNAKKCYLCSCDIGPMIVGAHIHRVADVKKDKALSVENKISQIIDGENGLWLCASHDKLFEVGLIFFKNNKLKLSSILKREQQKFVSNITERMEIESEYFTRKTKKYINLHFQRTQII